MRNSPDYWDIPETYHKQATNMDEGHATLHEKALAGEVVAGLQANAGPGLGRGVAHVLDAEIGFECLAGTSVPLQPGRQPSVPGAGQGRKVACSFANMLSASLDLQDDSLKDLSERTEPRGAQGKSARPSPRPRHIAAPVAGLLDFRGIGSDFLGQVTLESEEFYPRLSWR